MSQSTTKSSGMPTAVPSKATLIRSRTNRPGLIRLKPNRASITKVRYRLNGRSTALEMTTIEEIRAMPCAYPPSSNTRAQAPESHSNPPPKVSVSVSAAATSVSRSPTRALAMLYSAAFWCAASEMRPEKSAGTALRFAAMCRMCRCESHRRIEVARASAARKSRLKTCIEILGEGRLCGNSICQDRRFLARYMPRLEAYFHYRNLDVSTLKELVKRWKPEIAKGLVKQGKHEALADIYESIDELKYYRENFLKT